MVLHNAGARAAFGKGALHGDSGREVGGGLIVADAPPLEVRLVDQMLVDDDGVADLLGIFFVVGADGLAGKVEIAYAVVRGNRTEEAIADGDVVNAKLEIDARAALEDAGRSWKEFNDVWGGVVGIERVHDGLGLPLHVEHVEEVGGLLAERTADVAHGGIEIVERRLAYDRVAGVEGRCGSEASEVSLELLRAGLGDDLDAAIADAVELSRKGILVDADFKDGGFGRDLAAFEAIDIDLAAAGTGCGAC